MIAIVDYGMGNVTSARMALEHVGGDVELTDDADAIASADGVVLPGVGAFPKAMDELRRRGLFEPVRDYSGPLLGICLGMQLLFERSTEHEGAEGLGLLPGEVTRLETGGLRLPHIGWNLVRFARPSPLTAGLPDACAFYHVHTFAARPADEADVLGVAEYGERFASVVARDPLFGVQFHPEKSSGHGLRLLENFAAICARVAA
jgi:imidazole glycerol-phosphate synthase subunit HisH